MDLPTLLQTAITAQASDIHLVVGTPPYIRVSGRLVPIDGQPILTPQQTVDLIYPMFNEAQKEQFETNKEIDFSYEHHTGVRFRVNAYHQQGSVSAALRLLNNTILTMEQLQLPQVLHQVTNLKQGFVLVTGPTGSGKSTTLAAMIEEINQTRSEHIVTIEDPIEYVYEPKKSIISQRELQLDTHSWSMALRSVLREDPNIVLVGEMRDFETIAAALTIAETGHLVFATLHTNSAAQTIDRIIDVFPQNQQAQVRMQLASSLEAVFAQRLVPSVDGGRVPVLEIMLSSSAVKSIIREGKTHQIDNVIQTSSGMGMQLFEASLMYWVRNGVVSLEVAQQYSLRPDELMRLMKQ